MHISIFQAILLGLLYYLTNNGTPWVTGLGSVSIRQPIVCGAITGLILGDVTQGVIIGATINLGLLWDIADTFNGLMAIPNLIALLVLSGQVKKLAIDVDQAEKSGTL